MKPDLEKYRALIREEELSDARKDEIIHSVWHIMETFVDRAFGLYPGQQLGQGERGTDSRARALIVDSTKDTPSEQFGRSAGPGGGGGDRS